MPNDLVGNWNMPVGEKGIIMGKMEEREFPQRESKISGKFLANGLTRKHQQTTHN